MGAHEVGKRMGANWEYIASPLPGHTPLLKVYHSLTDPVNDATFAIQLEEPRTVKQGLKGYLNLGFVITYPSIYAKSI